MTIEQDAAVAIEKIRPSGRGWIWLLGLAGLDLVLVADNLASGRWLGFLLGLTAACCMMLGARQQRNSGIDLTPQYAIVRGFRRRNVPWQDVQEVISHTKSNGYPAVSLILEDGESVMLPAPTSPEQEDDAQFKKDFHRIDQYWHAHRGESWRLVKP